MHEKYKIALLELYYGKSGKLGFYNSQSLGLAKAYEQLGHEVIIVRPNKNVKEIDMQMYSPKITILIVPAKTFGVHSFYDLKFLINYRIDIVHLNADNQAYVPAIIKFCKKNNILLYNYVGTVYSDTDSKMKRCILDFFSRRNIRFFTESITFAKTDSVCNILKQKGVENAKTVPVGLDLDIIPDIVESKDQIREELKIPSDRKVLLYVGRLEEYKRPFEALELLKKIGRDYYLIAIGDGELQADFLRKIKDENLEEHVKYIDAIPNTEIHRYYKASDCFVNFNPKEIFGMSILEALYQGCPVVAKHAPGPDSIIVDGECGYLCGSIEEMYECIQKVNFLMGTKGKDIVKTKFSWSAASRTFLAEMKGLKSK